MTQKTTTSKIFHDDSTRMGSRWKELRTLGEDRQLDAASSNIGPNVKETGMSGVPGKSAAQMAKK